MVYLPQLSKVTEPFRKLECKKAQWCWLTIHDEAIAKLKQVIHEALVFKYFDPTKCDASERGLGYLLLQERQPVAKVSLPLNRIILRLKGRCSLA